MAGGESWPCARLEDDESAGRGSNSASIEGESEAEVPVAGNGDGDGVQYEKGRDGVVEMGLVLLKETY